MLHWFFYIYNRAKPNPNNSYMVWALLWVSLYQKLQALVCCVQASMFPGSFHRNAMSQRMLPFPNHREGLYPSSTAKLPPGNVPCWHESLVWVLQETFTCQVNASEVNIRIEMLPYSSCTESLAWDLFFPGFFYRQRGREGRRYITANESQHHLGGCWRICLPWR